jgi:hypothetical protein
MFRKDSLPLDGLLKRLEVVSLPLVAELNPPAELRRGVARWSPTAPTYLCRFLLLKGRGLLRHLRWTPRVQLAIFAGASGPIEVHFERPTAPECRTYPPSNSVGNPKALETLV